VVYAFIGVGLLVVVYAGVTIAGTRIPVGHEVSRSTLINRSIEDVWTAITDFSDQSWRKDLRSIKRLPDDEGREVWEERIGNMAIPLRTDKLEAPRRLVRSIANPKMPFRGCWLYELEPEAVATRVTITEQGEVLSPFFRFINHRFMDQAATVESYIRALDVRFAQDPQLTDPSNSKAVEVA